MGRRILNRKDLRADVEAAERRKKEVDEVEDEAEEEDEDEDEEEDGEAADESEDEGEDSDEEEAPKKRKPAAKEPKAKAKPKAKPKPRSRAAKVVRMKVVWGVFNNSNQRVAVYEYPKRKDAEDHATRLTSDKKSTHFVQAVKEPLEEKKEV